MCSVHLLEALLHGLCSLQLAIFGRQAKLRSLPSPARGLPAFGLRAYIGAQVRSTPLLYIRLHEVVAFSSAFLETSWTWIFSTCRRPKLSQTRRPPVKGLWTPLGLGRARGPASESHVSSRAQAMRINNKQKHPVLLCVVFIIVLPRRSSLWSAAPSSSSSSAIIIAIVAHRRCIDIVIITITTRMTISTLRRFNPDVCQPRHLHISTQPQPESRPAKDETCLLTHGLLGFGLVHCVQGEPWF